jgi:hypothetical protein
MCRIWAPKSTNRLWPLNHAKSCRANIRILSQSFALVTMFTLNTVWGLVALYTLMAIGLVYLCLKELMVGLGPLFFDQPGVFVPKANVIAILYQFSVLIVPTLGPAIIWVWQSRESPLLQEALGNQ